MIVTTAIKTLKGRDGLVLRAVRMTRITALRGALGSKERTEAVSMSSMRLRSGLLEVEQGRWRVEGRGEEGCLNTLAGVF